MQSYGPCGKSVCVLCSALACGRAGGTIISFAAIEITVLHFSTPIKPIIYIPTYRTNAIKLLYQVNYNIY
uniref:Uncharacterized protein n=1 Tax=Anguilla anguilla TaxID=7936 RepID=A0A0E9WGM9_ANGAN